MIVFWFFHNSVGIHANTGDISGVTSSAVQCSKQATPIILSA